MKASIINHIKLILKPLFLFLVFIFIVLLPLKDSFAIWPTSPLINQKILENLKNDIRNNKYGKISSIVIFHGNKIIYENYFGFSQVSTLHPISSVTKSITSLATGVCIDKGLIPSIDAPIYEFFPEYKDIFERDPLKKSITLKHLLSQTAGLAWDEWSIHYSYAGNQLIDLSQNPNNWCQFVLSQLMSSAPGEKFNYNSGCSELIKEIISRTSGQTFEDFVKTEILYKLGITHYHWDFYPGNGVPAWGGLSLNTRDMAHLGILVLNNGKWNNIQIVSKEWIELSVSPLVDAGKVRYGLHWWVGSQPDGNPLIYAAGYGDQYVYIAPDKNLVIAFNGQNFTDYKWEKSYNDLINDVLNAYNP